MKRMKIQKKSYSTFSLFMSFMLFMVEKARGRLVGSQPGGKLRKIPLMPGALIVLPQASRAAGSQPSCCFPSHCVNRPSLLYPKSCVESSGRTPPEFDTVSVSPRQGRRKIPTPPPWHPSPRCLPEYGIFSNCRVAYQTGFARRIGRR